MKKVNRLSGIGVVVIVSLILVAGCSAKPQSKPVPKAAPTPPVELKKMQASLDELYSSFEPEPPIKTQGSQNEEGDKDKKKSGEEGGQGSARIDWGKLQKQTEEAHELWNGLEPKLVRDGARTEDITGMEKDLDLLPAKIAAKERSGFRLAVNGAAGYLPDFMELYDKRVRPDLYRMRVLTRDVLLRVGDGNWEMAEQDVLTMKSTWSRLSVQLEDAPKVETDKNNLALLDLERAIERRDSALVSVKGNILGKNLEQLIKKQEAKV